MNEQDPLRYGATARGLVDGGQISPIGAQAVENDARLERPIARWELAPLFHVSRPSAFEKEAAYERLGRTIVLETAQKYREQGFWGVDEIVEFHPREPELSEAYTPWGFLVTGSCDCQGFAEPYRAEGTHHGEHADFDLYWDPFREAAVGVSEDAVVLRATADVETAIADVRALVAALVAPIDSPTTPLDDLGTAIDGEFHELMGGTVKTDRGARRLGVESEDVTCVVSAHSVEGSTKVTQLAALFDPDARIDVDHVEEANFFADDDRPVSVRRDGRVVVLEYESDLSVLGDGLVTEIERLPEEEE